MPDTYSIFLERFRKIVDTLYGHCTKITTVFLDSVFKRREISYLVKTCSLFFPERIPQFMKKGEQLTWRCSCCLKGLKVYLKDDKWLIGTYGASSTFKNS